jgi:hypothetical protein
MPCLWPCVSSITLGKLWPHERKQNAVLEPRKLIQISSPAWGLSQIEMRHRIQMEVNVSAGDCSTEPRIKWTSFSFPENNALLIIETAAGHLLLSTQGARLDPGSNATVSIEKEGQPGPCRGRTLCIGPLEVPRGPAGQGVLLLFCSLAIH